MTAFATMYAALVTTASAVVASAEATYAMTITATSALAGLLPRRSLRLQSCMKLSENWLK